MSKATEAMLARWEPLAGRGAALDVAAEMRQLTLRIVGFALFSLDLEAEATTVGQAFTTVNTLLTDFPTLIVPTLRNRRLRAAARKLDPVVYDIITSRRKREADDEDLLSLLLVARDEETGKGMSDEQLHDEVLTLLLAGYETTANALSWTWYLLARHPAVEAHLHAELECDAGRAPPDGRRLVPSAIQSHGD